MANIVKNLMQDVADRIGNPMMTEPFQAPLIIRKMNDVYHDLCDETRCLQKEYDLDEDNRTDDEDYWELPSDFVELYRLEGEDGAVIDYVEPVRIDSEESEYPYQFSIYDDKIYFQNAADDFEMTLHYYSRGFELVNLEDADLTTGTNTNTPEFGAGFYRMLVLGTCLELTQDYKGAERDLFEFERIKSRLRGKKYSRQSTSPFFPFNYEMMQW